MGWFNKEDREAARAAEERLDAVKAYDDWCDARHKASWWH